MAKSGIEYDASLLALAKPSESALTAAGKALQNGADFYWQNKLNTLKSKLGEEELTAAQLKNEFDKENNPLTLEANKELLKQSQIKTDADTINLDTLMKTQEASISKANSDAKLALIDVIYKPKHYEAQINQNNASAANAYANANYTRTQTDILNEEHAANLNFGGVINARAKGDLSAINEEYSKAFEALQQAKNDPTLNEEQKKELTRKEQLLNLSYTNSIKNATSSINAEARAAKAQEGLTGNVEDIFGKMDVKSINVVSGLRETAIKMNNLAERLKGIDPHFGATGRLGADTLRMLGTPQYAALKGEIFSLIASAKSNGDSAKFKAEMNALEQTYKNPYDWFGTDESLDVLLNTIAYDVQAKAQARVEANTLAGKGNIPLMQAWQDNIVSSVQPFRMGYIGKNNNTKISSFNATNSGQNTGASSNQPFVHNARAKPNDLSSFDNSVNVK